MSTSRAARAFRITLAAMLAAVALPSAAAASWSGAASMATARIGHRATLLPDGTVLVAGGEGSGYLASAERYDPGSDTWSPAGAMNAARYYATATLLRNGKVLVAGGEDLTSGLSFPTSAELYDPASNTWSSRAR